MEGKRSLRQICNCLEIPGEGDWVLDLGECKGEKHLENIPCSSANVA